MQESNHAQLATGHALQRRHLFLLTATPVQNDLLELYNLLTLLEPGHLRTESDFKKQYVRKGNPRDPRNRERLRALLSDVMIRNTRGLVNINLPPRYAQTLVVKPGAEEERLYHLLDSYLRWRCPALQSGAKTTASEASPDFPDAELLFEAAEPAKSAIGNPNAAPLSRMQLNAMLLAAGSHPAALIPSLEKLAKEDERDRNRLCNYYNALLKETDHRGKNVDAGDSSSQEKRRAVELELRRKLGELDERYALRASVTPLTWLRLDLPVLAVTCEVFRKQARREHAVYWNPILTALEPMCCSRCGDGIFSVSFSDEDVLPLCNRCAGA